MADVKISQLTALASASTDVAGDVLAIVDTSATQTKKISVENLVAPLTLDKTNSRVGIGTASPEDLLHIQGGTASVSDTQLVLEGRYGGYGAGVNFVSRTSSGGTNVSMAKITADGEAAFDTTAANQDAGLRFFTTLNGSSSEAMRITSGNLVQINQNNAGSCGTSNKSLSLGGAVSTQFDATNAGTFTGIVVSNSYGDSGSGGSPPSPTQVGTATGIAFSHHSSSSGISYVVSKAGSQTGDRSSLHFGTRGSDGVNERMVINDNSFVGIGTTNPSAKLHVAGGSGNDVEIHLGDADGDRAEFIYRNDCDFELRQTCSTGAMQFINEANRQIEFHTAGTERIRILNTGGITFNGDTATANALDDYEEGTSTATLSATSSGSITIGTSLMQDKISYTKIGQIVFFKARLTMTVSSPSGELRINNLPFDAANPSGDGAQVCTVYFENSNGDLANDIVGLIADGSNTIIIRESGTGGTGTNLAANAQDGSVLIVSGHYFTVSV